MLLHDDRPQEHVLIRWSDGSESPTWEPLELVRNQFPNVLLEDKEVAIEAGVDMIPQQQPGPDQQLDVMIRSDFALF